MADRDPKTGQFLPGNKIKGKAGLPAGLLKKIRNNRPEFYKAFIDFGAMTLEECKVFEENPQALSNMQAAALQFWILLRHDPSVQLYSMAFQIYCIKMDVIQSMVDEVEDVEKEVKQLPLTKKQKLEMLTRAKELVENEK